MAAFDQDSAADEVAGALAAQVKGKTVLITGASPSGLGAETARAIARQNPKLVILAGHNLSNLKKTEEIIKSDGPSTAEIRLLQIDLGSQASVRNAAKEVNGYEGPIDVLINNAGIMAVPFQLSIDGLESQLATNYVGHFLFTNLIISKLLAAKGGSRVVNVSSSGHKRERFRFEDYNFQKGATYDRWKAYGQSKTANMLFTVALAERLGSRGLLTFSLYPGRVLTNIARSIGVGELKKLGWVDDNGVPVPDPKLRWKNLSTGASTQLVAAFDPSLKDHNGSYLDNCQVADSIAEPYALDHNNAEKLWALSEGWVGQKFTY